jgi:hypothetical protein
VSAIPIIRKQKPDEQVELLRELVAEVRALRDELRALQRAKAARDAGRAEAIRKARERADYHRELVVRFAADDVRAGKPDRGRPGRVMRKLRGLLSESQVRRILRTLTSARDSLVSNPCDQKTEEALK